MSRPRILGALALFLLLIASTAALRPDAAGRGGNDRRHGQDPAASAPQRESASEEAVEDALEAPQPAIPPAEAPRDRNAPEEASEKAPLAVALAKGDRLVFRASSRRSVPNALSLPGHVCVYEITVLSVSAEGDATCDVRLSTGARGSATESASESDGESDAGSMPADAAAASGPADSGGASEHRFTLTVGADGRVQEPSQGADVPAELEMHFQFILGSGLHDAPLRMGRLYELDSLYDSADDSGSSGSSRLRLRYDGMGGDGPARFTILARRESDPSAAAAPDQEADAAGTAIGDTKLLGGGAGAAGNGSWSAIGEASYRLRDGLLVSLKTLEPADPRVAQDFDIRRDKPRRPGLASVSLEVRAAAPAGRRGLERPPPAE